MKYLFCSIVFAVSSADSDTPAPYEDERDWFRTLLGVRLTGVLHPLEQKYNDENDEI